MLKMLSGLAFGYFLYTKEGREQLSSLGNYLSNTIKSSFKDLTNINKKENKDDTHSKGFTESSDGRTPSSEVLYR